MIIRILRIDAFPQVENLGQSEYVGVGGELDQSFWEEVDPRESGACQVEAAGVEGCYD